MVAYGSMGRLRKRKIPLDIVGRPAAGSLELPKDKDGGGEREGRGPGDREVLGRRAQDIWVSVAVVKRRVNSSSLGHALLESEVSVVVCLEVSRVCLITPPGQLRNQQL